MSRGKTDRNKSGPLGSMSCLKEPLVTKILEVEHLVKNFPLKDGQVVWAISDVSFDLSEGETLGLVGESGSGKTTIGRCLLRLIEPTSGSIRFQGTELVNLPKKDLRAIRPQMQMIFQEVFESLNPRMTVGDIVDEPLKLWTNQTKGTRKEKIKQLMSLVELDYSLADLYPHQLTGGQQQCVGIARAIALNPKFLVLDEPTSALDPTSHAEIMDVLKRLQEEFGFAYLFISHDLTAVEHISHRVAILYLSKLIEIGRKDEIFRSPQHPYTNALLSSVLFPDPNITSRPFILCGEIPSAVNLPKGCFLYKRCPVAVEGICDTEFPKPRDCGHQHKVYCHNLDGSLNYFQKLIREKVCK